MQDHFGNTPFLRHHAQGLDQFPLVTSFKTEEETFLRTVKQFAKKDVPAGANIICSHTICKVKQNDDGSLKLKALIAPHGNEDDLKSKLHKDCSTYSPSGLRILESAASLHGWTFYKADVTAAFLQTGIAQRDVYVRPPRESQTKTTHLWLLLTAAYGLVNSNAKWQNQSDAVSQNNGLVQSKHIPQLFFKKEAGKLVLVVAKIVDDLKAAGIEQRATVFLDAFDSRFKVGTVNHGPGKLRFFGINTTQDEDYTIATDNDKLQAVMECPISRQRRKEPELEVNAIEKGTFASINSSLGWIGIAASPLCLFYSSYLQQKAPDIKVSHLVEQANIIRKLKKMGTTIKYPRPTDKKEYHLSILIFSDASRSDENGQHGIILGLLVGELERNAINHTLSWISHKSKRPVKSVPATGILAASEGIDEGVAKTPPHSCYTVKLV